ncbi:hypothetical protein GQ53DRAFT_814789 [Thozetella sp. PMI_491]|nr:hypothetical protein GQ53DRAFT_814789 [Thozetella sp. PMI_491]
MQFTTIIATVAALAASASAAAIDTTTLETRAANAVYNLFGGFNCQAPLIGQFQITSPTNTCLTFPNGAFGPAISLVSKNLNFNFIVYENAACTGNGTPLGTGGCFSDAAGIRAFKLVPF